MLSHEFSLDSTLLFSTGNSLVQYFLAWQKAVENPTKNLFKNPSVESNH